MANTVRHLNLKNAFLFLAMVLLAANAVFAPISVANAEELTPETGMELYDLADFWLGCHVSINADSTFTVAYDYGGGNDGIVSLSGTWERASENELTLRPEGGDEIPITLADGAWRCEITEPNTHTVCHPSVEIGGNTATAAEPEIPADETVYTIRYADPEGTIYYTVETNDLSALPEIDKWVCEVTDANTGTVCHPSVTCVTGTKITELYDLTDGGLGCHILLDRDEKTYVITFDYTADNMGIEAERGTWVSVSNPGEARYILLTSEAGEEKRITLEHLPTREGYTFAGWQSRPDVTKDDLILGVSPYEVVMGASSLYGGAGMSIAELVNAEDNSVTVYSRWAEPVEIHTAADLRSISDDLYGYYVLAEDIDLSGENWQPIGMYFSTYETVNAPWWTFAFRGTFDGNGHNLSGLTIGNYTPDATAWETSSVWKNDGEWTGAESALFGALSGANVHDLVLDHPALNITGDGSCTPYVAPLAGFDIASRLENITVVSPSVTVTAHDRLSEGYAWISASGLVAGGWSDTILSCEVQDASITINGECVTSHGGEYYVGSVLGEGYAFMYDNKSTYTLDVTVTDNSQAEADASLIVNVGGMGGTNTTQRGGDFSGTVRVAVNKPTGASTVSIGGLTGSQRYQVAENNTIHADITADCQLDPDHGKLYVGQVIGSTNIPYCIVQLIFADPGDVAYSGCRSNTSDVTLNGEAVTTAKGQELTVKDENLPYIANGDLTDEETGETYISNIDDVISEYGSAVPASFLRNAVIVIIDEE